MDAKSKKGIPNWGQQVPQSSLGAELGHDSLDASVPQDQEVSHDQQLSEEEQDEEFDTPGNFENPIVINCDQNPQTPQQGTDNRVSDALSIEVAHDSSSHNHAPETSQQGMDNRTTGTQNIDVARWIPTHSQASQPPQQGTDNQVTNDQNIVAAHHDNTTSYDGPKTSEQGTGNQAIDVPHYSPTHNQTHLQPSRKYRRELDCWNCGSQTHHVEACPLPKGTPTRPPKRPKLGQKKKSPYRELRRHRPNTAGEAVFKFRNQYLHKPLNPLLDYPTALPANQYGLPSCGLTTQAPVAPQPPVEAYPMSRRQNALTNGCDGCPGIWTGRNPYRDPRALHTQRQVDSFFHAGGAFDFNEQNLAWTHVDSQGPNPFVSQAGVVGHSNHQNLGWPLVDSQGHNPFASQAGVIGHSNHQNLAWPHAHDLAPNPLASHPLAYQTGVIGHSNHQNLATTPVENESPSPSVSQVAGANLPSENGEAGAPVSQAPESIYAFERGSTFFAPRTPRAGDPQSRVSTQAPKQLATQGGGDDNSQNVGSVPSHTRRQDTADTPRGLIPIRQPGTAFPAGDSGNQHEIVQQSLLPNYHQSQLPQHTANVAHAGPAFRRPRTPFPAGGSRSQQEGIQTPVPHRHQSHMSQHTSKVIDTGPAFIQPETPFPAGPSHSQDEGIQSTIPPHHPHYPHLSFGRGEPSRSHDVGLQSDVPRHHHPPSHQYSPFERGRPSANVPAQPGPSFGVGQGFVATNVDDLDDPFVEPGANFPHGDPTSHEENNDNEIDSVDAIEETFKTPSPEPGEQLAPPSRSWLEAAFHANRVRQYRRERAELQQWVAHALSLVQGYEEEIGWLNENIEFHLSKI